MYPYFKNSVQRVNWRRAALFLFSAFLLLTGNHLFAKRKKHMLVNFQMSTIYDNNILRYSDQYLKRFIYRQDSGRFHINTYDDIILAPALKIYFSFDIFKKNKTLLSGDFRRKQYLVNNIKSWNYFNIGIKQEFARKGSFKLFYSYIPDFYVRHFRDKEWVKIYGFTPVTFQPFSFQKENLGTWIQYRVFIHTIIRLSFLHSNYYYNSHFTEYNSKNNLYGIKIKQTVNKNLRMEASYYYVHSKAKGYDASYQTPASSYGPDASFTEHRFFLSASYKLPRINKYSHYLEILGDFRKRYFSSANYLELDPLHAGRIDNIFMSGLKYKISLNKSLQLSAFCYWFGRKTTTLAEQNKEYVSNEKDYSQYQTGMTLVYKLKM